MRFAKGSSVPIFPRSTSVTLALLLASPALAATDRDPDPRAIVVTATRAPQPVEAAGQPVTVVTRADLDRLQLPNLADVLAQTPGVTVTRNGGAGQPTAVRIRGAEDAQTLVVIDGVRVNDPSAPAGAFDFGNLLSANIARVEVLRGAGSVPWGSAAIGGVVNVTTGGASGASVDYGARNSLIANAQLSHDFGRARLSGGGGVFRDRGISAFVDGRERDGFSQTAANAKLDIDVNDALNLEARGYYARGKVDYDGFPPPSYSFADTADFARTRQAIGYAGARLKTGAVAHRVAFTIADTRRNAYAAPATAATFVARGRSERFEYQGDATLSPVRLVFGVEHETTRFADADTRYSTGVTSGYAQAIATFGPVSLTGGARVDDDRAFGTHATFAANGVITVAPGTTLRAAFSQGFKAPTLFQLYSAYGNTALRPETAQSYEVGVEHRAGRFAGGATLFRRDTRDQVDFFSCFGNGAALCKTRPFGFYANIARTRTDGGEAWLRIAPDARTVVTASYSYIDARDRLTGLALLRRPQHSVAVSGDWAGPIAVGATVRLVSDSADIDYRSFARTSLDGYALVDFRASVALGPVELFGRVENLADVRYTVVSGYGVEGRSAHVGVRVRL